MTSTNEPLGSNENLAEAKANARSDDAALPKEALIAEDDPILRRALQRWLEAWNYRVTLAQDGQSAWEGLCRPEAPKMVILDWVMPGLDGIEVCRRIRHEQAQPYRYVLLLTARDNKEDIVAGLDAGADDYLTKPFHADELRARIRSGQRILELQDLLLTAQQSLQFEAQHDRLTTVWNRGAILDSLIAELQRRQRSGEPLGVIMADVDRFKAVNDTHGHLVGDIVLREIARRLSATVRAYDRVGRYGGEEFLIVVPGCGAADLITLAERLRLAVAVQPLDTEAGPLTISISLGLSFLPADRDVTDSCEGLLRRADAALYSAKKNGRNRVELQPLHVATAIG